MSENTHCKRSHWRSVIVLENDVTFGFSDWNLMYLNYHFEWCIYVKVKWWNYYDLKWKWVLGIDTECCQGMIRKYFLINLRIVLASLKLFFSLKALFQRQYSSFFK
jgi:hypothetical protein